MLSKKVVGHADRELIGRRELFDNRIVIRIVLRSAAGVYHAGDTEAVQFAEGRGISRVAL